MKRPLASVWESVIDGVVDMDSHRTRSVLQLVGAHGRLQRIGADHENESLRGIDRRGDLLHPVSRGRNALPVHPRLAPEVGERRVQTAHEIDVLA